MLCPLSFYLFYITGQSQIMTTHYLFLFLPFKGKMLSNMPLAAQTCRVAAITNGRIMSRAHKYLSVRASNLQQNRGYTFRSLHTAVGLHTKYPPRDGQFDMKIATLRPASPSTPDDFIKALGLSKNGVIGQLATVIVPDITSRTGLVLLLLKEFLLETSLGWAHSDRYSINSTANINILL